AMARCARLSRRSCGSAARSCWRTLSLRDAMSLEPILFATAPERGRHFADKWRDARPEFCCVLGHTDTCLLPGISTAGVSEDLRPLTPAADAEVVNLGVARCLPQLPSSPLGAPGPAGITRTALKLMDIEAHFFG